MIVAHKFKSIRFTDDDEVLTAAWVLDGTPAFYMAFEGGTQDGCVLRLPTTQVMSMLASMQAGEAFSLKQGQDTLRTCPANRGEPYRDGMEISITDDAWNQQGVFVELADMTTLTRFIREGIDEDCSPSDVPTP